MNPHSTTFAKATLEYDRDHERALVAAISKAIAEASLVTDANVIVLRTAEIAAALMTTLASVLACSPAATRSPTALRKVTDNLHKRLRKQVASAEQDADTQEFLRRIFRSNDTEGEA